MGEKRRKDAYHQRIRSGEFQCVYCGGIEPSAEPDHMPPIALFSGRRRPNDLVFPSCVACNRGSSAIDVVVSWLARMYPDSRDPQARAEVEQLGRSMMENFPEVATAFRPVEMDLTAEQRAVLSDTSAFNVDDPYVHSIIEHFGAKFGFGMHWRMTGQCVSTAGRVYARWFTNYMAISGRIPAEIFKVFPNPLPLMQGRWNTAGRFEHASAADGDYSSHVAIFGQSFIVLAFVAPKAPEPFFTESGSLECAPGCLKVGYPYGLPRLSTAELNKRLDRA
jgi:hypothetical protein